MKCFYHPDIDGVGLCQQCGKSACRQCIDDVGGTMLCTGCIAREQDAQQQQATYHEQQRLFEVETTKARAISRLRWSWIIAIVSGLFYGFFAFVALTQHVTLHVAPIALVIVGPYVWWSIYWGFVWCWPKWRRFVQRLKEALSGWILIARPITWIMLFFFYVVFYLSVPFAGALYYGIFGGGIYQFLKHRRIASGAESGEPAAGTRGRAMTVAVMVVILVVVAMSLSVWQQYRVTRNHLPGATSASETRSNVVDYARVLNADAVSRLTALCASAKGKYQLTIMMLTEPSAGREGVRGMATDFLQRAAANSGTPSRAVVILLAVRDRKWWIQPSPDLQPSLNSAALNTIGRGGIPLLRRNDYGGALAAMADGIVAAIQTPPAGSSQAATGPPPALKGDLLDKIKVENDHAFKGGDIVEFYCLVASVEHPRAGVMISCEKPGGRYLISWGDTLPGDAIHPLDGFGTPEAFEQAALKLTPKQIVRAHCIVMPQYTSDQLELYCGPPVKVSD